MLDHEHHFDHEPMTWHKDLLVARGAMSFIK